MPGAVLYREGDDATADDRRRPRPSPTDRAGVCASARSRRATRPTRSAARTSRRVVRPEEDLARGAVLLARGRRRRRSAASTARSSARSTTSTASARPRSTSSTAARTARSTCPRSAPSSASSRRGAARSSSTPTSLDLRRAAVEGARSRPAEGASADDAAQERPAGDARRRRRRRPSRDASPRLMPSRAPADERRASPAMTLEIDVLTLFPAMIDGPLGESIPARIQEQGLAVIRIHDLREWGLGRHRSVDDAPYGGGAGMILRPEPVAAALDALRRPDSTVDPARPGRGGLPQARAADLATRSHLIFVCPRYEGVDERIRVAGRPRDLDRRLRADRRRAAGPRRHRCRHPAPARAPSRTPRSPTSPSPTGCSSTRNTRDRRSSAGWTCPRS